MILLLLWAFVGVGLGYEAARHGVVQIIVPTLYLFGVFLWAIAGMALVHFVTSRKARPTPTPQQIRDAFAKVSKSPRPEGPQIEREP